MANGRPSGLSFTNIAIVGGISIAAIMLFAAFSPGFRAYLITGTWGTPPAA